MLTKISHVHHRKYVYSEEYKKIVFTLHCQSPAAYRTIQSHFHTPCKTTLNNWFKPYIDDVQNDITKIENVSKILEKVESRELDEEIQCTLVVDAFSASTITLFN